ncbi:hypothetical protein [Erwinia phyllosphaerae]|uniref:hypothetical protein n=1 Tax=Erwinia phyllosphaerae TaxID=2853256 RepID=UPI001FEE2D75|nr:hypothetical protein [Erwinia phyllosphaerae]MBV4366285.1 hypothetical protein [Erwinia phyllosphaerae]
MTLVKVLGKNLFAGAGFQKLEAGKVYEVADSVAEKWIKSGQAEVSKDKKGESLQSEVATPSSSDSAASADLQSQLDDALDQVKQLQDDAETKEKEHADALAAETRRADDAEAALAAATKKDK